MVEKLVEIDNENNRKIGKLSMVPWKTTQYKQLGNEELKFWRSKCNWN